MPERGIYLKPQLKKFRWLLNNNEGKLKMAEFIIADIDIEPLLNARNFLASALDQAKSDLEIAGTIQAFEFCYELSWKTLKKVLAYRGIILTSPREVFRAAAAESLISDVHNWFEYIRKRNLTVHIYNKEVADEIFVSLPKFLQSMNHLITTLQTLKA